jgi:lipopolysaccharide export system permease protein
MKGKAIFSRALGGTILTRYLAMRYLTSFLMLFFAISITLEALSLLSESGDILAGQGASARSLLRYTYLNWPQLATQLPPFVSLMAALMTFATLNQRSEIIVMKSVGLSPFRIVRPLVLAAGLVAVGHFVFNEWVVVPTTRVLTQWQETGYAMVDKEMPPASTDTWATEGGNLIRVRSVTRSGTILDDVTYYIKKDGLIDRMVTANFAAYVGGKWTLFDVKTFDIEGHKLVSQPEMPWPIMLPPERFLALSLQRETISFVDLIGTVRQLKREGQSVTEFMAWLNQKVAGPVSSMVMPFIGALAAFGVFRGGMLFARIAISAALGFSFFVVDNLLLALGQFGSLPAMLAAWAPLALFLCIGLGVIVYAEE